MFERVLVPLDGSGLAESVLPLLEPILKRADTEVLVLQVAQYPAVPGTAAYVPLVEFEAAAREYVKRVAAELTARGIRARGLVRVGPSAVGILEAAEEERVSLVALTTHGRTGLVRWLMGSVAEKVIRSCPAPALVFRSFPKARSRSASLVNAESLAPDRILVPVDGSENSLGVVPGAIALARLFSAHVTILRVHEPGETVDAAIPVDRAGGPRPPERTGARPYGEVSVQRALRLFMDAGVAAELVETEGDPGSRILETADRAGAKLIALATHGRTGPTRWLLGSVAEKVLRASDLPVLVVRSPGLKP